MFGCLPFTVQMDLHELQVAGNEVASIEAALSAARAGVAEAEAERQRLTAEGPAAHRKKDLLDKVGFLGSFFSFFWTGWGWAGRAWRLAEAGGVPREDALASLGCLAPTSETHQ